MLAWEYTNQRRTGKNSFWKNMESNQKVKRMKTAKLDQDSSQSALAIKERIEDNRWLGRKNSFLGEMGEEIHRWIYCE